jgi:adenosylhomocysteinase
VQIYDTSFANAFRGYYVASQQHNQLVANAALGWLKGDPNIPASLRKEFNIRGSVDKDNAFQFLQAISSLLLSMGYAGVVVIFDEAELIRGISRTDSRNAAYENIRLLLDKTAQNELKQHLFLFAGTEDLFNDELRGIPSYQALHDRIKLERGKRKTKDLRHPLIPLEGFDRQRLVEVAKKVRRVHGVAYGWQPEQKVTDALIEYFVEETVQRFGEKFKTIPRGFLKVFVDILDMIEQHPEIDPLQEIRNIEHADTMEAIEREEARLSETTP